MRVIISCNFSSYAEYNSVLENALSYYNFEKFNIKAVTELMYFSTYFLSGYSWSIGKILFKMRYIVRKFSIIKRNVVQLLR